MTSVLKSATDTSPAARAAGRGGGDAPHDMVVVLGHVDVAAAVDGESGRTVDERARRRPAVAAESPLTRAREGADRASGGIVQANAVRAVVDDEDRVVRPEDR